ncbi:hypothetical protein VTJ04DRAFT_7518 [Mycothermus thermophilus]|uniref:uncharacterized protein n=1 Tax=Humicola insolens TaxID=85995 RepID=UPI003743F334
MYQTKFLLPHHSQLKVCNQTLIHTNCRRLVGMRFSNSKVPDAQALRPDLYAGIIYPMKMQSRTPNLDTHSLN